jgi:hypothetical protein
VKSAFSIDPEHRIGYSLNYRRWGMRKEVNRFLQRVNRYCAYLLIPVMFLILMTGFRMTGHFPFIPRGVADLLHRIYLNVIFLFLFALHLFLSLRFALLRRNIGGKVLDALFILAGAAMIGFFSYLSLRMILPIP